MIPSSSASASAASDSSRIDDLLVSYMRKRGFQVSADSPANSRLPTAAPAPSLFADPFHLGEFSFDLLINSHSNVSNSLLFFNSRENSPDFYEDSYSRLFLFVSHSLDFYSPELQNVLWPVFVHSFLQLINRGFTSDAFSFLSKHRSLHLTIHAGELQALAALQTPESLHSNELIRQISARKMEITMSSFGYELLISFLEENSLFLILKILNQHVQIRILTRRPMKCEFDASQAAKLSEAQNQTNELIHWGLMPRQFDELKHFAAASNPLKRSRDSDDRKELYEKITKSASSMPELSESQKLEYIADFRSRMQLSSSKLPSIAKYSIDSDLTSFAVSNDGSAVAAAGNSLNPRDSIIKYWNLKESAGHSQCQSRRLIGHSSPVLAMSFSPEADYLISGGVDSSIRLWNLDSGRNLVNYSGHSFPIWSLDFCPLGVYFASASADRTVRLWSSNRISPVRIFTGHLSDVTAVKFHPNCNYLVSASTDLSIRVWDSQSGDSVRLFRGFHKSNIRSIAVHPDGRQIASADEQGNIAIWDIQTARVIVKSLADTNNTARGLGGLFESSGIAGLEFSADGELLASAGFDGKLSIFSPAVANASGLKSTGVENLEPIEQYKFDDTSFSWAKFTRRNLLIVGGTHK